MTHAPVPYICTLKIISCSFLKKKCYPFSGKILSDNYDTFLSPMPTLILIVIEEIMACITYNLSTLQEKFTFLCYNSVVELNQLHPILCSLEIDIKKLISSSRLRHIFCCDNIWLGFHHFYCGFF